MCAIRLNRDEVNMLLGAIVRAARWEFCTRPADRAQAEDALRRLMRWGGLASRPIVWCGSPRDAQRLIGEGLVDRAGSPPGIVPMDERARLLARGQAIPKLRYLVSVLGAMRYENLPWDGRSELYRFIVRALHRELGDAGRPVVYHPWMRGHHDAPRFEMLRCVRDMLQVRFDDRMNEWLAAMHQLSMSCGWVFWCEDRVLVCERPEVIRVVRRGRDGMGRAVLHSEDGPALCYPDQWRVWVLNGVVVPQEVVETPADRLDPRILLHQRNAEVRREIIRKIGIVRVMEKLGAEVLDRSGDYELVNIPLGDGRIRPYLKMVNPSTGTVHLEGVGPHVRSVEEALQWRNQVPGRPEVLT